MKIFIGSLMLSAGLVLVCGAQAKADSAAGATAVCNDGEYTHVVLKSGACSHHGGIRTWYGMDGLPKGTPVAPAPMSPPMTAATAPSRAAGAMPNQSPVPGAPGVVWGNPRTKVFHCAGDPWYGRTLRGAYMNEADALAKGYHPDHGKSCR